MHKRRGHRNVLASAVVCLAALGVATPPIWAQTVVNANWTDGGGNWTNASDWSCNCVPNNSSASVFNVTIPTGDVSLDSTSSLPSVTINTLTTSFASAPTSTISTFLSIENGESLAVTGGVDVRNGSGLYMDNGGSGGSSLHVGANLTDEFYMDIGGVNIPSATTVTVAGTFTNAGVLEMYGGNAAGAQALLSVGGAAPNTLSGAFDLYGAHPQPQGIENAGGAAVDYAGGGVTQITGDLELDGSNAYVELSGAPGSNSALTGLKTISGTFRLYDGASLDTSGPLTNNGDLGLLDGSALHVDGDLTNSGSILQISSSLTSPSTLAVAGTLTNTAASQVSIFGGSTEGARALLNVSGAASSTLTGTYGLNGFTGGAAVEFGSGGITQIGDGSTNSGRVDLNGPNAYMELSSATGSNSAMTGLNMIASNGQLDLEGGASLSTTGHLTNYGDVYVEGLYFSGVGTSTLHVGGGLTTTGSIGVDGTLIAPTVDIAGGKLFGSGTIEGDVTNGSIVLPGYVDTPVPQTTLTINGNYTQNADGTLVIDILSATDFSILDVTGKVSLDGTVDFDFLNGYVPGRNTDFAFLKAGSVSGDFAALDFVGITCPTCTFNLNTLSLDTGSGPPTITPEPSSLILFGTALLGLSALLRRKQRRLVRD